MKKGFATKLKLVNEKFTQPVDTYLNLSGNTQIYYNSIFNYAEHPTFTGDTQIIDKKYVDDNLITGLTATTTYSLSTPSTVDVGGLDAGSELTGFTSNEILEKILVATLYPELTGPNNSFSITGLASVYEVGYELNTSTTATFNRGSINPQYDATSPYRSGPPNTYNYNGTGLPATTASTSLTDSQTLTNIPIVFGVNSWSSSVSYDGGVQPYDSKGNEYDSPLPSGTTASKTVSTTGYYPYFYGASETEPTFNQTLINNSTKVVGNSNNTVAVTYPTSILYQWLAIPFSSTAKEGYYFSEINIGNIGTEEDLFGPEQSGFIDSPDGYWNNIQYRFYVTTYASKFTSEIQFRNNPQQ